jgi:hypothetical protein
MNIYEFVNSRDIREFLQEIDFVPNALESAWLVYQSNNHTIEEKREAWRWIIDNMPDCEVSDKNIETPQKSLHDFLKKYMEIENAIIANFFAPESGAVYTYRALWKSDLGKYGDGTEWYKVDSIFATFDEAYADATEDNELAPLFLEFEKKHLGAHGKSIRVRMTPDRQPVFLDEEFVLDTEEESDLYYNVFFYLHFDFPTPFSKGDIICPAKVKYKNLRAWDAIFAIGEKDENGTPMGYMAEDECVYCERIYSYMDFELLEGEPRRDRRMLLPISKYLRGEIDLALLLGACRMITLEMQKNETNSLLGCLPTSLKIV